MRPALTVKLAILVAFVAALAACGEKQEPAAPEVPAATQAPAPAAPAPPPVAQPASIHLEIYKAGSAEAANGGIGILNFQGESHSLTVAGVSLPATASATKAEVVGQVQQLQRLEDIEGAYTADPAGAVVGGGPKIAQLENAQGVSLKLLGKQLGKDLSLDLNGMQIRLVR